MKKRLSLVSCLMAALLSCSIILSSCFGGNGDTSSTPTEYTIQYTDDAGLHSLSVTSGSVYSLDVLPEKYGYEFLGLFDAKTGGTQYIDETGSSLSAFTDNKNMVLFPQFKAKEYTLILDYQGAAVTGSRSITVSYDSVISELPMNLSLENKEFMGWYTEPNCKGTQIADENGVFIENSKVTEKIFDLSNEEGYVYLYAGYEMNKYTVTFYFEDNNNPEELKIEHGTYISEVVPETRVDGQAVLYWSKTKNDTEKTNIFTGKVTGDMILYAAEYAPVIDFDENGGEEVTPVVARVGSSVSLPTPTRENYKFIEWQDGNGNAYNEATMPDESITLKAVWQAMLVFDENGGMEVDDISKVAGEDVELPIPEKEGYIFAGWYTADKEKYEGTKMPAVSQQLKAGWYKVKSEKVIVIESNKSASDDNRQPSMDNLCYIFNYSAYFKGNQYITVEIDWHVNLTHSEFTGQTRHTVYVDFYSQEQVSSTFLIGRETFENIPSSHRAVDFKTTFTINDNFYICWYMPTADMYHKLYLSDFYYTVHYPDTTTLYL